MNDSLPRSPLPTPVLPGWRICDLTHPLHPNIPLWPSDPALQIQPWTTYEQAGYLINRIAIGEHSGTHWGTPNTLIADARNADQFSATELMLAAIVIDIRSQADSNPDYGLSLSDIQIWEQNHGTIPAHSLVILWTGWQDRWADPIAFFNSDAQGVSHFPGFSPEVADFLVHQRQIAALGTDTHGIDCGMDHVYTASSLLYKANGMILECLAGLDQLPARGALVIVGGLPIQGGSGSPARILALVPTESI